MAAPSGALRSAGAQGAGGRCAGPEGRRRTVLLLKSKSTESDGIKSLPPSLCHLIPYPASSCRRHFVLYPSSCFLCLNKPKYVCLLFLSSGI